MIWWIIATLCAFYIKGLCGFANTLLFGSILSFTTDNINISPVELLLGYPTNIILAWKERKSIDWRICVPLALLVVAGIVPGVLFLKNADTSFIKIIFGVVIILVSFEMLIREWRTKKTKQSKLVLLIIGIISGLLCGLYGIGALVGAYVGRVTEDNRSFKGNICVVFWVESTIRLILYTLWGIITFETFKQAIQLIPFMLIGLLLGMFSEKFLNEKLVKKIVILMLLVSGVVLIMNNL